MLIVGGVVTLPGASVPGLYLGAATLDAVPGRETKLAAGVVAMFAALTLLVSADRLPRRAPRGGTIEDRPVFVRHPAQADRLANGVRTRA
jgi:hypothetical protein